MNRVVAACFVGAFALSLIDVSAHADPVKPGGTIQLSDDVKARCVEVLTGGLHSDEFWPSIHAAEGLTMVDTAMSSGSILVRSYKRSSMTSSGAVSVVS